MLKKIILASACVFGILKLQAQETVSVSGGGASGNGGTSNYSVGQVVYATNVGNNGSVSEGVQQPYEISVITSIKELKNINLSVSTYPNPVLDVLTLRIEGISTENYRYELFDSKGILLETKVISDSKTSIDMINYVPSTYFLKVIDNKQELKVFKVVKN